MGTSAKARMVVVRAPVAPERTSRVTFCVLGTGFAKVPFNPTLLSNALSLAMRTDDLDTTQRAPDFPPLASSASVPCVH